MISRRTWTRIVFLGELLSVAHQVSQWCRFPDDDNESLSLRPRWLVASVVVQTTYCWSYDHNIGDIRTNRWRRGLLALVSGGLGGYVFPVSEREWRNVSLGASIGVIGYRLWYGVLRPLPGTDE